MTPSLEICMFVVSFFLGAQSGYFDSLDKLQKDWARLSSIGPSLNANGELDAKTTWKNMSDENWSAFRRLLLACQMQATVARLKRIRQPLFVLTIMASIVLLAGGFYWEQKCPAALCHFDLEPKASWGRWCMRCATLMPLIYLGYLRWNLIWLAHRQETPSAYV